MTDLVKRLRVLDKQWLYPIAGEAADRIEQLESDLDKIGDAVSLVIDGKDCTVEGFCKAIHEYQMDSIALDKAKDRIEQLEAALKTIVSKGSLWDKTIASAVLGQIPTQIKPPAWTCGNTSGTGEVK